MKIEPTNKVSQEIICAGNLEIGESLLHADGSIIHKINEELCIVFVSTGITLGERNWKRYSGKKIRIDCITYTEI